jgi:DNA-binding response OmpR family regulator
MSRSDEPRRPHLLLVEDERHLATTLKLNLEIEGYEVALAATAREGAAQLLAAPADAILLDVMLPDENGFAFCRRLREAGNYTPVIMLTARGDAEDRVQGLEAGADDYVAKPFALAELVARVRSVLRRRSWERASPDGGRTTSVLLFGDARIDFDTHAAEVAGRSVSLTQLEIDLARYFAANEGRVLSRAELIEKVWKLGNYPNTRTVDNFVMRLRRHFEADPANPRFFLSVRGRGYRFVAAGEPPKA